MLVQAFSVVVVLSHATADIGRHKQPSTAAPCRDIARVAGQTPDGVALMAQAWRGWDGGAQRLETDLGDGAQKLNRFVMGDVVLGLGHLNIGQGQQGDISDMGCTRLCNRLIIGVQAAQSGVNRFLRPRSLVHATG